MQFTLAELALIHDALEFYAKYQSFSIEEEDTVRVMINTLLLKIEKVTK